MNSVQRHTLISVAMLAALLSSATPAVAEEEPAATANDARAAAGAAPIEVRRNPFGSKPMTSAALAARRGGDRVFNDNKLKGVVADNKASNLTTGANVITDGAFAGSSGMPTVIQNSGNNVLIQNSTIVNVQLK